MPLEILIMVDVGRGIVTIGVWEQLCVARILSSELEAFYLQMDQFHLGPMNGIFFFF